MKLLKTLEISLPNGFGAALVAPFGRPLDALGRPWAPMGALECPLDTLWAPFGPLWGSLGLFQGGGGCWQSHLNAARPCEARGLSRVGLTANSCQLFQLPCYSRMLCIEGSASIHLPPHFDSSEPSFCRSNFVFVFVSILVPFWSPKRSPKVCQKASKTCTVSVLFSDLRFCFLLANFRRPPGLQICSNMLFF